MYIQDVIIRPLITEKAMRESEKGKYGFVVGQQASKALIKLAVEAEFKVHVTGVQTSTIKGRKKRVGMRRSEIDLPKVKKALVTVKKGEKIGIFEPGGGEEASKKKK